MCRPGACRVRDDVGHGAPTLGLRPGIIWVVLLCITSLPACHRAADPDPASLYRAIHDDFVHGDLDVARSRAHAAQQRPAVSRQSGDTSWPLRFLVLEAEIALYQGHPQEVASLLTAVPFPPGGDPAIKRFLLCSQAYRSLGRAEEAEANLAAARRLAVASDSAMLGDVLQVEGLALLDDGQLDQAEQKLNSSLTLARSRHDRWLEATDLVDISDLMAQHQRYDPSRMASLAALDLSRSLQARVLTQWALGNLGWDYLRAGDFENARADFQQAGDMARTLGQDRARVIWLWDAGTAAYNSGDPRLSEDSYREALLLAQRLSNVDETTVIVNIQSDLALLLYRQSRYEEAERIADAATLAARGSRDNNAVAYATYVRSLLSSRQATSSGPDDQMLQAWKLATDVDIRSEIENKIANLYARGHDRQRAEVWYQRSIKTFDNKRSSLQDEALRLSAFSLGDEVYQDYARFLIDAGRQREALQLLDAGRARTLEEGLGFGGESFSASKVQPVLPQNVARRRDASILFYAIGKDRSYLWAINAGQTRLITLPKQQDIQQLLDQYQRVIQQAADPLQSQNPTAIALYRMLVEPVADIVAGSSRVYLIPDGPLTRLNFETLLKPTPDGCHYLIEDVSIAVTGSIRMLSRADVKRPGPGERNLLLIGNPVATAAEYPALAHGADEIDRVRRHFASGSQTVLTQADAIPASYRSSDPEHFSYVHFVAHGTASELQPLESAVVLSPASSDPATFKLYARDIVQQPLRAELVTVSACYGSGVRAYVGEGLVGLTWAFLRAGAHHVIGALWEVNDDSTPLLMDRLYDELAAGQSPDAALRIAKLSLLHSSGVYRKPFYWATFQLYAGA
jgi:CHAT domain-containing protein/Tfp pilus assembly protein PilF